jgi:hypothetical protein
MQDATFNGLHLPTVARIAREMGSPIKGSFAAFLWSLSNRETLPVELATDLMKEAGYKPFCGYPLVKAKP